MKGCEQDALTAVRNKPSIEYYIMSLAYRAKYRKCCLSQAPVKPLFRCALANSNDKKTLYHTCRENCRLAKRSDATELRAITLLNY